MIINIVSGKFYSLDNEELSYLQIPKPSDFFVDGKKIYTSGFRGRQPLIIWEIINGKSHIDKVITSPKNKQKVVVDQSLKYTPKNKYEFFIFNDRTELHINGSLFVLDEKSLMDLDLFEFIYGVFPAVVSAFKPYIKDFIKVPKIFKYPEKYKPCVHESGNKILMTYGSFSFIHLLLFYKKVITQESIVKYMAKYTESNDPCQMYRHFNKFFVLQSDNNEFKSYGYDGNYTSGSYVLWSITEPKPFNIVNRDILDENVWNNIKIKHDYKCQLCGSIEGQPHMLNPSSATKLEKGHVQPHLPLSETNCVPHCHICNKQIKNDYYLENNDNGQPILFINYGYMKSKYGLDKCDEFRKLIQSNE